MDISGPFRGSAAVAAGVLSRGELAGPRLPSALPRRVRARRAGGGPRATVPSGLPAGRAGRGARGLFGRGVARGLLRSTERPGRGALPAVTASAARTDRAPDALTADETVVRAGLRMTTPARTAFDLARWQSLVEGVTAVDALAHRFPFDLGEVRALRSRHLGAHGGRRIERVLALVDPRSESPMESRTRVALVLGGLFPAGPVPGPGRRSPGAARPGLSRGAAGRRVRRRPAPHRRAGATGPVPRSGPARPGGRCSGSTPAPCSAARTGSSPGPASSWPAARARSPFRRADPPRILRERAKGRSAQGGVVADVVDQTDAGAAVRVEVDDRDAGQVQVQPVQDAPGRTAAPAAA